MNIEFQSNTITDVADPVKAAKGYVTRVGRKLEKLYQTKIFIYRKEDIL
ncbi:hypothetical protein [Clostridium sp. DJ247]|nr:hypothetical protein [Clostridium sp. DJ247]MBC2581673.1 hypothetical protein [Clostridium sp. DJ247]